MPESISRSSLAPLRCYLIGADSLLAACGDVLLSREHAVLGVLTRASAIAEWARSKNIAVFDPADGAAVLAREPFDHLFAITHLAMIPAAWLKLPQRSAINFHDGPLPLHAGMNAPAWALIEGERRYGITWHEITAEVDAGAILAQKHFDLAPGETSLTLNARCFETALETFSELVDGLAERRVTAIPQDPSLRSYHARWKRPAAACAIDWRRSAKEIEALVRALDFGRYTNPLGLPKVSVAGAVYAVVQAQARSSDDGGSAGGSAAPGTVLSAGAELVVATGRGALAVRALATQSGTPIAVPEFLARTGLRLGERFDALEPGWAERLTALHGETCRSEAFWSERLSALVPVELPYVRPAAAGTPADPREIAIAIPNAFRALTGAGTDAAASAIAAWLARISQSERCDVGWSDPELARAVGGDPALGRGIGGLEDWFATRVPWRIELAAEESWAQFLARTERSLEGLRAKKTWLRDLVARTPSLAGRTELAEDLPGSPLPVAIVCEDGAHANDGAIAGDLLVFHLVQGGDACRCTYDARRIAPETAAAIAAQVECFLTRLAADPDLPLAAHDLLPPAERNLVIEGWNRTETHWRTDATIERLIEEQIDRTPERTAVVCNGDSISYRELEERSNRLAAHLRALGAGPEQLVGLCLERSVDLAVALLAILKSGAAWLPLDPAFPKKRLAFMLADARAPIVVTDAQLAEALPEHTARLVRIDADFDAISARPAERAPSNLASQNLAYILYTSGSTGTPKGVMVEHRNVASFFAGIDERIEHADGGTWLAVTSLSFDISVLELLWTLTRGFTVVIYRDEERTVREGAAASPTHPIDFSLFYFSSDESEQGADKYRLLLEGARFADTHGFAAVWTPERHFHAFGGLYPHPAITSAAVAAITSRVGIRAGSVVLPLHHPIRVAEAWSVVDNLSNGRVGVSFASGWQPNDFVLAPENFKQAKRAMFTAIETVQRLWRGETLEFPGVDGAPVALRTLPRPIQRDLPTWVTTAGNPETYEQAGAIGANLLTHLLGQSIEQLAPKIAAYRRARAAHGHDPEAGVVTLMLHTYVGEDEDEVLATVREPLRQYLASSLALLKHYAWAFPAFAKPKGVDAGAGDEFAALTPEEHDAMLDHAFERYYATSGLFGRAETCLATVERLKSIGVGEIACLIDFGVPVERALAGLAQLDRLRRMAQPTMRARAARNGADSSADSSPDSSIGALIRRHRVTHLQCTPSLARMLCLDDDSRTALRSVKNLMIGGEPFPVTLLGDLAGSGAAITNMYGPTETTIWSSTEEVDAARGEVGIGRPIANTRFYVLDKQRNPLPVGVPGELWIAGAGVARGYHARAELTAERFLVDPFAAGDGGARMYKTGDLVRWRRDGTIEFLGRADHQIKLRGFRIELGEIEKRLESHPAVREAVVLARVDASAPDDPRLVAYVVPASAHPDTEDLRTHLRAELPEYMVPAHYVVLERLPLAPNGKIDRAALPAPDAQAAKSKASSAPPAGEIEELVAGLWRETLGLERVGREDNFFDLGGHSLLVVRLQRRLQASIERPVSLTDLYRFPTVRSLAEFLGNGSAAVDLQPSADRASRRRESIARRRRGANER